MMASVNAAIIAAMPAAATRTNYAFAVFARFAIRDFLRFALFLWIIPRAAALSKADDAALWSETEAPSAVAFLARVLSLLVIDKLRFRRFSEARVHLMAALILGTRSLSSEAVDAGAIDPNEVRRQEASIVVEPLSR